MGHGQSMSYGGVNGPLRGQTAKKYMKTVLGEKAVKSLKSWHNWSQGTSWCIPPEGTFDVWRWEKFISEFKVRLQTEKSLDLAQLWLQQSIMVSGQGVQKAISVRKNQVMYTWPEGELDSSDPVREAEEALSGLTLLKQAQSTRPASTIPVISIISEPTTTNPLISTPTSSSSDTPPEVRTDYSKFLTRDLCMLCEARGINTASKNREGYISALQKDDYHQSEEGDYHNYSNEQLEERLREVYKVHKQGERNLLITQLWQWDLSPLGQPPPLEPHIYPSLSNLEREPTIVAETVHVAPPLQRSPTRFEPGTYPVRVQQIESPPDNQGVRTPGERVIWHVPFSASEVNSILNQLPDYRSNPRGFARVLKQNQFSFSMSGTDCARILRAKIGDEVADSIMTSCGITTQDQPTSGGKEFCKLLLEKLPVLYGATSSTDVMKIAQNPGEDCAAYWGRLKRAALDADLEVGPDDPPVGSRTSAVHLMLKAKFLEGINTKVRERLSLARPEYNHMPFPALLSTLTAIERDMEKKKHQSKVLVAQMPHSDSRRGYQGKPRSKEKHQNRYGAHEQPKEVLPPIPSRCYKCKQEGHRKEQCTATERKGRWHFIPDDGSAPIIGMVGEEYDSS